MLIALKGILTGPFRQSAFPFAGLMPCRAHQALLLLVVIAEIAALPAVPKHESKPTSLVVSPDAAGLVAELLPGTTRKAPRTAKTSHVFAKPRTESLRSVSIRAIEKFILKHKDGEEGEEAEDSICSSNYQRSAFEDVDEDKSGWIDLHELEAIPMPTGWAKNMMNTIDTDGDGKISFLEFSAFIRCNNCDDILSCPADNGETMCEAPDFVASDGVTPRQQCHTVGCCQWIEDKCKSAVGRSSCSAVTHFVPTLITVSSGEYASEVQWSLDCDGLDLPIVGSAPYSEEHAVPPGKCKLTMSDSWGDGWNGASWSASGWNGQSYTISNNCDMDTDDCGNSEPGAFENTAEFDVSDDSSSSTCTSVPSLIRVSSGQFPEEVSWTLDCDGLDSPIEGRAPYSETHVMSPGECSLSMFDSWGDGWNGAEWSASGWTDKIYSVPHQTLNKTFTVSCKGQQEQGQEQEQQEQEQEQGQYEQCDGLTHLSSASSHALKKFLNLKRTDGQEDFCTESGREAMFSTADTDDNDSVSMAELGELAGPDAAEVMAAADTNGDGMMSYEEFSAFVVCNLCSGPEGAPEGQGGEAMCEGKGYTEDQCSEVGCCQWDDEECWSAVGSGSCDGGPPSGSVICDGLPSSDYCDCNGDCGGSYCQCADALACCSGPTA